MSSATVRAAITGFFQAANIPGLNKVFTAPPYWADGSEWDLSSSLGSGAVGAVHLAEDTESRITFPALSGNKQVEYTVGFMIFYQWLVPSNSFTAAGEDAWAAPLDTIIDGVKTLLRSDPNCGMPAVIWQSGQEPHGIAIRRDLPRKLEGKVVSWNVVQFHVTEIITA